MPPLVQLPKIPPALPDCFSFEPCQYKMILRDLLLGEDAAQSGCSLCEQLKPDDKNVWREGSVCLLDTLSAQTVMYILERDEVARRDLLAITQHPFLQYLALTVKRLSTTSEAQIDMAVNKAPLPFYTIFRGMV